MNRSGSVVSANSMAVPAARPESGGVQKNAEPYKSREISFMRDAAVKAKKFLSVVGAKVKNIFPGQSARRAAGQAPQREKPAVSAPFNFTHLAGAGISGEECKNPFLTRPVQAPVPSEAPGPIREQSTDPRRVADLVADNPLLKKASTPLPANGIFNLCADIPVYKSAGPLRGSLVGAAYQRYNAKMSALRMEPIMQRQEEKEKLKAMLNGIHARIDVSK